MSATRESEKAQAEQHWRRLVALRQRRRKGTPAAAVAVNNLGVLLVEQLGHDSAQAKEGRRLLRVRLVLLQCSQMETVIFIHELQPIENILTVTCSSTR